MSPDPFRPLDRLDPPDQWDEVTRRATDDAHDVVVDLAAARPPRRRALGVAAAALVVVALGAAVLATRGTDDDGLSTTATDPSGPTAGPTIPGDCPFGLATAAGLPPLEPGRSPAEVSKGGPDDPGVTWGHVIVDDLSIEVLVSGAGGELSTRGDDEGVEVDGMTLEVDEEEPTITVAGWEVLADEGPCSAVHVFAQVPFRAGDPLTEGPTPPSEEELAPYVEIARPTIERVRDAVVLAEGDGEAATEGAGCMFALDDAALPDLTPKAEDEEAPFTLLDGVTDRWLRGEVDRMLLIVGVGGRPDGPIEEPGARWVADEADFATGDRLAMVRANEGLAADGPCTDAVVHVVFPLTDDEVAALEAGTIQQPDIAAPVALAERVLDAVFLVPDDTMDRWGEPTTTTTVGSEATSTVPGGGPTPAERPDDVLIEAEPLPGHPVYVYRDGDRTCLIVAAASRTCSDGSGHVGGYNAVPLVTADGEGLAILGTAPAGTARVEITSVDGPVTDAEVVFSDDRAWYLAWAPATELRTDGAGPIAFFDADGERIPTSQG